MRSPSARPSHVALATAAAAAALSVGSVWAISFGPVRTLATMGQPLDASVELLLQPGELPADHCVSAQVNAGDTPLPPSQVTAQLIPGSDGSARVRVRTSNVIEEPFLTLTVSVGCDVRFARQFTVFADPPAIGVVLSAQPLSSAAPVESSPLPRAVTAPREELAAAVARPRPSAAARSSSGEVRRAPRPQADKPVQMPPNRARAPLVASAEPVVPAQPDAGNTLSEQRISTGTVSRGEGVARLKLDTPTVSSSTREDALLRATQQREEAMATARIAVDVAEAANSTTAQKIIEMEAQLAAARKELAAVQSALARIQAERAAAPAAAPAAPPPENPWYSDFAWWLAAACAALLLLSVALYLRLRRTDAQRLQGWHADPSRMTSYSEFETVGPSSEQFALSQYSVSPPTIPAHAPPAVPAVAKAAAMPPVSPKLPSAPESAEAVTVPAALMPAASPAPAPGPVPANVFTETQPSTSFDLSPNSRFADVSIEELLDVEQQAEFFEVLGQDVAAIELLTNHVMATGGASPMPFLKLLEIFRRAGDQASYERTRKRFNARFNGVAPEWGADPNAGRGLVDYPEVLARIERSWPNPVDAMAELQTLMFRNDSNLLFDLPAYRDILMLFTLARDHHEGRACGGTPVDVLLPLKSSAAGSATPLPEPLPMDENLRLVLEDPSPTVQVSVRRR